ncbi:MAG: hypothetical protein AAGM67_22215, partial [Bacteroidota bacterium]
TMRKAKDSRRPRPYRYRMLKDLLPLNPLRNLGVFGPVTSARRKMAVGKMNAEIVELRDQKGAKE